jgi:hypothetical protein
MAFAVAAAGKAKTHARGRLRLGAARRVCGEIPIDDADVFEWLLLLPTANKMGMTHTR